MAAEAWKWKDQLKNQKIMAVENKIWKDNWSHQQKKRAEVFNRKIHGDNYKDGISRGLSKPKNQELEMIHQKLKVEAFSVNKVKTCCPRDLWLLIKNIAIFQSKKLSSPRILTGVTRWLWKSFRILQEFRCHIILWQNFLHSSCKNVC